MYKSILVPLDGSAFSEPAIPYALELARRSGGALHLAHVHSGQGAEAAPDLELPRSWTDRLRSEREAQLNALEERIGNVPGVTVNVRLREGMVLTELRAEARDVAADLIVMTTHGRGGVTRAWLGSVADRFVRSAELPVLLVRPSETEDKLDLTRRPGLRDVLIPLDGSELATTILDPARSLLEGADARVTLLRVIPDPGLASGRHPATKFGTIVEEERRLRRQREEAATEHLEATARRLRDAATEIELKVRFDDDPARGILREAEERGSDVIAIATRGRGAVGRAVLGSVADKVIRGANMPVLVYRPPER